jgi:hypothetical protein
MFATTVTRFLLLASRAMCGSRETGHVWPTDRV